MAKQTPGAVTPKSDSKWTTIVLTEQLEHILETLLGISHILSRFEDTLIEAFGDGTLDGLAERMGTEAYVLPMSIGVIASSIGDLSHALSGVKTDEAE